MKIFNLTRDESHDKLMDLFSENNIKNGSIDENFKNWRKMYEVDNTPESYGFFIADVLGSVKNWDGLRNYEIETLFFISLGIPLNISESCPFNGGEGSDSTEEDFKEREKEFREANHDAKIEKR